MNENVMELAEGDWIIHTRYGLGQVMCMEEKELLGERKNYYNVKTEIFNYWLSISSLNSGRVRHVARSSDFSKALDIIASEPAALDENFHNRLQSINDLLAENTIFSKAQLIRDINARNVRKDIHANEKGILETLKGQFVNELALSCQVSENDARDKMQEALKKSSANVKPKKPAF